MRLLKEVAAAQLSPFGIGVNLVTPGGVDTPFVADAPAAQREMARRAIPMRCEATPTEIAPAVVFLLSLHRLSPIDSCGASR